VVDRLGPYKNSYCHIARRFAGSERLAEHKKQKKNKTKNKMDGAEPAPHKKIK
jgi:hypothetical protein